MFGSMPQLRRMLNITLAEAANGCERRVEHARRIRCKACEGKGGAPGAHFDACPSCGGNGLASGVTHGPLSLQMVCDDCRGMRGIWSVPCAQCDGRGGKEQPGAWTVQIPPGVPAGHVLRLAGQGNDLGQGAGDLFLEIAIEPHPFLTRRGDDLVARMRIDPELAQKGGELRVRWLEGEAVVRVPPGSAHGAEVRRRGWGTVRFGAEYSPPPADVAPYRTAGTSSPRGDLVVILSTEDEEERQASRPQRQITAHSRATGWIVLGIALVVAAIVYAVFSQT
jgi:molecular chaperone DnaJ